MHPTTVLEPLELSEATVQDVPASGEFVACTSCGHRSYMHFYFMDDFMSFCAHHGEASMLKLESLGASLVADHRDDLSNR